MDHDPEAATLAGLEAAVQRSPGSVEAWLDLAAAYTGQGMPALAAEMVERAYGLAPRSADLLVALGDLRNEAEDAFERAVGPDPRAAGTWSQLGALYALEHEHTRVLEVHARLVELDPGAAAAFHEAHVENGLP